MDILSYLCHVYKLDADMNQKTMWHNAGIAGLALGGVSTVYMFGTQLMTQAGMSGFLLMAFNTLLWIAKFGGCIWLMMYFMKKYAAENPEADNSATFRFGMASALLSALIFSAASFANMAFISVDLFNAQMEELIRQTAPFMDSNSMSMLDKMSENMPQITFFSNLIYCFIYGTLVSAILSRNIPSKDPFADYKPEHQQ